MATPGGAQTTKLSDLFARFIQRQATEARLDLVEPTSEVIPHQAVTFFAVDPRTALREAVHAATLLPEAKGFEAANLKTPPDWASLVQHQEPLFAVPLWLGSFPQLVRDVTPLMSAARLAELQADQGATAESTGVADWGRQMLAKSRLAEAAFAIGTLRLTRELDAAAELFAELRKQAPAEWEAVLANEEAALAWHRGDTAKAAELWAKHREQDSAVILFNRALADLFAGRRSEAAARFEKAAAAIPETSGWHHLARLYVTLARVA
jgi:tetratricopeptide (TPR) repeat protein